MVGGAASLLVKFSQLFSLPGPKGDSLRGWVVGLLLREVGKNFKVAEYVVVFSPQQLKVGDNVYLGKGSYLGNGPIELGDEVLIGNHVSITPANHLRHRGSFRFGGNEIATVKVGAGSWLGANSSILSGVEIGEGCLVGAGSVVTKPVPAHSLVAGNPARIIRKLSD